MTKSMKRWEIASGGRENLPFTPGSDMAGVVEAAGAGASRFKVGDRVLTSFTAGWLDGPPQPRGADMPESLGGNLPGVLAEYVALPEEWLVATPGSLNDSEASTLPIAGLTAWQALIELGHLQPGQTVLVQGTGGVSLFALQIEALAPGGRVSVIGLLESFDYKFGAVPLFRNQACVQGIFVGPRRSLENLVRAIDRLRLKPVIDEQYAFADLPRAFDHLGRGPFGKVVLRV